MRVQFIKLLLLSVMWLAMSRGVAKPSVETAADDLIGRLLPKQAQQFVVEIIPPDSGRDVFEIESQTGKIILRGNNGVAIASALNWHLKNECHCDISWNCGDQLNVPVPLPVVPEKVRVISPH